MCSKATKTFSRRTSSEGYSGSTSWLKHVCDVGNISGSSADRTNKNTKPSWGTVRDTSKNKEWRSEGDGGPKIEPKISCAAPTYIDSNQSKTGGPCALYLDRIRPWDSKTTNKAEWTGWILIYLGPRLILLNTHMYIYIYVCIYVCMYVCIYVCVCVCA